MSGKFIEAAIVTTEGLGEGFIKGYFAGRGETSEVINLEREGIERESLKGLIEEFMHPGEEIIHLLIPERCHGLLQEALGRMDESGIGGIEKSRGTYERMSAGFKMEIYNREKGSEAKALILGCKRGVTVDLKKELKESVVGEAEGVELYAPAHSYSLEGGGRLTGGIEEVLELTRKLREAGVEVKDVRLCRDPLA